MIRDVIKFAVSIAFGVLATVVVQAWVGAVEIPEGIGDLVSGIATLIATGVAALGFTRWEDQRRRERQAEAASDAMVVAWQLAALVRRLATTPLAKISAMSPTVGVSRPYNQEERDHLLLTGHRATVRDREQRARMDDVRARVETYLPRKAADSLTTLATLIDELDKLYWNALRDWEYHRHLPEAVRDVLNQAVDDVSKRTNDHHEVVKAILRPHALLRDRER